VPDASGMVVFEDALDSMMVTLYKVSGPYRRAYTRATRARRRRNIRARAARVRTPIVGV